MNHVPVIVRNPAYVEELEPDEEVDQADFTPHTSGDSPIITVPASEDKNAAEDESEDDEEDVPHILREAIQNLEGLNQELRNCLVRFILITFVIPIPLSWMTKVLYALSVVIFIIVARSA